MLHEQYFFVAATCMRGAVSVEARLHADNDQVFYVSVETG